MASKKKSASKLALAVGQAKVQASDLQDRIGPAVEDARERLAPVVADARERITPVVEDARIRLTPVVEDARGRLTPVVEDARDRLTPVVGDAKERLADLAGTVAVKLDESLPDKATPAVVAAAAKRSKGSGRLKKLFVVAGIGAAAAVIAQKLRSNGAEPQWQSTPPGRPTPAPAPSTTEQAAETASAPAAAVAGLAAADAAQTDDQTDEATGPQGGVSVTAGEPSPTDAGGGSPDEAASDATDTPHEPTTPDSPAEKIEIKE